MLLVSVFGWSQDLLPFLISSVCSLTDTFILIFSFQSQILFIESKTTALFVYLFIHQSPKNSKLPVLRK